MLDITHNLNNDFDIILKATFYIDPSLISEDDIVHVKGDCYKVLDWEYSTCLPEVKQEIEKQVTLTLQKVIIWKYETNRLGI